MEAPPVGIRINSVIDAKALNFEGLRSLQGAHCSVWCEIFVERLNCAEVRGWAHLNRSSCDKGQ